MMGKSIGMFNDTGDKDENDLDVEKLKSELKAKMASMLNVTLPSAKHWGERTGQRGCVAAMCKACMCGVYAYAWGVCVA